MPGAIRARRPARFEPVAAAAIDGPLTAEPPPVIQVIDEGAGIEAPDAPIEHVRGLRMPDQSDPAQPPPMTSVTASGTPRYAAETIDMPPRLCSCAFDICDAPEP